ncbi:MAG: DUF434 domain-containing protein [Isosphaeraceae bacterium]
MAGDEAIHVDRSPEARGHRGADPRDVASFGPSSLPALRTAVSDLSWLLEHRYAPVSALKLVGDRWKLTERQRAAVRRASCSDEARNRRRATVVPAEDVAGRELWIDGFNVLTTIESWLGGAVVLHCRDGTYRDLAGIHGTYRRVAETFPALNILADVLRRMNVRSVRWLFDRPVSNSGRIRDMVLRIAAESCLAWTVELVSNPDPLLEQSSEIVVTADSAILDAGPRWFNLLTLVIDSSTIGSRVIELSDG